MFKFLHAADVHLDSPLRGLERFDEAPVERIRRATRRAFENLVELALNDGVELLLLAGDLYDGDWRDYNTGLFFVQQMARLRQGGCQVFLIEGNHDAASRITRSLPLPDNVHRFPSRAAATHHALDGVVAIHGQGFATAKVTDELWRNYPPAEPEAFNIGLMHTSLAGRPGHEPYAPCTEDDLRSLGYDYWALGHVHAREVVSEDPYIVFPGNLQGRHVRETGEKGCVLVTVDDSHAVTLEPIDLDVLRWLVVDVDLQAVESTDQLLSRVEASLSEAVDAAEDRAAAVRVRLVGSCTVHDRLQAAPERWAAEIRALAATVGGEELWLEKVKIETTSARDLTHALTRDDALGGLLRAIAALDADRDQRQGLTEQFADLRRKLPSEVLLGEDRLDPTDPECLAEPLEQAKELLITRLLGNDDRGDRS